MWSQAFFDLPTSSSYYNIRKKSREGFWDQQRTMEAEDIRDIVIVGAEIFGLATAVGIHRCVFVKVAAFGLYKHSNLINVVCLCHRLGIRSIVLESREKLRPTGFALTTCSTLGKPWIIGCVSHSCVLSSNKIIICLFLNEVGLEISNKKAMSANKK